VVVLNGLGIFGLDMHLPAWKGPLKLSSLLKNLSSWVMRTTLHV
jgi:hypothetical protein